MAIQILGDGNPDGSGVVSSATEKLHLYGGTAVVQPSTIATTASTLVSLRAKFNLLLAACKAVGVVASS